MIMFNYIDNGYLSHKTKNIRYSCKGTKIKNYWNGAGFMSYLKNGLITAGGILIADYSPEQAHGGS